MTAAKNLSDSKAMRWFILLFVSILMFGAYMFVDLVAPLEDLLEKSYGWTPSNYGFYSGSEYWLNVCGFLILSGIILDKMGVRFTGLISALIMIAGGRGFGHAFFSSFMTSTPATVKVAAIGFGVSRLSR